MFDAAAMPAVRFPGLKRDPRVRAIVTAWRRLGASRSGRPTVVACSGGADSVALLLALATATDRLVVAHITHDLRTVAEAAADRDFVKDLAGRLEVPFVEASVAVRRAPGTEANVEARARVARYRALARLARESGCGFVAVAHHADDQLETVLMALMRGAGARGLSGMPVKRSLGRRGKGSPILIRPMLAASLAGRQITRMATREICSQAAVAWREDATNADTSLLRAAVRHRVVPTLSKLRPNAAVQAVGAASVLRDAQRLIGREARRLESLAAVNTESATWHTAGRAELRRGLPSVLFEVLRRAHRRLAGRPGLDRMSRRAVAPVVRAIRDMSTEPREFTLARLHIRITVHEVCIERKHITGARS